MGEPITALDEVFVGEFSAHTKASEKFSFMRCQKQVFTAAPGILTMIVAVSDMHPHSECSGLGGYWSNGPRIDRNGRDSFCEITVV
jgi:hypothetical protein